MDWAGLNLIEFIGTFLGLFFTLSIFSYILGDNMLFRFAIHVFIGVAAGFMTSVILRSVIVPQLLIPIISGSQSERLLALFPLILSGLLLFKVTRRFSILGSPIIAFLVGVGAAAAIGGTTLGTLFPQISASANLFDLQAIIQSGQDWLVQLFYGGIILVGTVLTFAYFQFSMGSWYYRLFQKFSWLKYISWIGQALIAITFGVLYAGVLGAAISALIERINFLWSFLISYVLTAS